MRSSGLGRAHGALSSPLRPFLSALRRQPRPTACPFRLATPPRGRTSSTWTTPRVARRSRSTSWPSAARGRAISRRGVSCGSRCPPRSRRLGPRLRAPLAMTASPLRPGRRGRNGPEDGTAPAARGASSPSAPTFAPRSLRAPAAAATRQRSFALCRTQSTPHWPRARVGPRSCWCVAAVAGTAWPGRSTLALARLRGAPTWGALAPVALSGSAPPGGMSVATSGRRCGAGPGTVR